MIRSAGTVVLDADAFVLGDDTRADLLDDIARTRRRHELVRHPANFVGDDDPFGLHGSGRWLDHSLVVEAEGRRIFARVAHEMGCAPCQRR